MNEDKLKTIIEEVLKPIKDQLSDPDTGLAAINKRLYDPDIGLAAINKRLDVNTTAIVELESTVKGYADMYKINDDNIRKAGKRLETLEEETGVEVPPELKLEPLPEAPQH